MKYNVTIGDHNYEVEIENLAAHPIIATVDGERIEVWPEARDETRAVGAEARPAAPAEVQAALVDTSPLRREVNYDMDIASTGTPARSRSSAVSAPIPGAIVSIAVKPGQRVDVGQELCVLDAMKMESPIRASREGTIGTIHISVGDNVKHHQLLMEYAD